MTLPIERAARALMDMGSVSADPDKDWRDYVPHVRAVLDAIHEPSEGMKEGGAVVIEHLNPDHGPEAGMSDVANVWRYMIDAMRKEI